MMVYVKGNSGSGKSWIGHSLKALYLETPLPEGEPKPEAYRLRLPSGRSAILIGRYDTTCGGADGIRNMDALGDTIRKYAEQADHLILERLLGSDIAGGRLAPLLGSLNCVHLFLDTPLETCIERIKARRTEAGNAKPLNEENTRKRHVRISRAREMLEEAGAPTLTLDHREPLEGLHDVLGESLPLGWETIIGRRSI